MVLFSSDFWYKATYDVKILPCSDYRLFKLKEGFTKGKSKIMGGTGQTSDDHLSVVSQLVPP